MTGQLTKNDLYFKCFGNCFKIVLNKMIYKMTLLLLPWGSERDRKMVSEHGFQTSKCDTHKNQSVN